MTNGNSIQIEYNEKLQPLEKLLGGVERTGAFYFDADVAVPMPTISVDGIGVLSFPVPKSQVEELVARAASAPYGRGHETVLDERVRKVRQIAATQVHIGGRSWPGTFKGIMAQVSAGLGCDGSVVSAELYKLLVYQTGGFFLSHRDTEKGAGMFGTLVLVLPSAHSGGELVVRHNGRAVVLDMSGGDVSEIKLAAFYADCEHEVLPVTSGNRVCLVYNLLQRRRGATSRGTPLVPPDYELQTAEAARLLRDELDGRDAPVKIAWLLEHQYSPASLSFAALKSSDAARVQVLANAADRAECEAHLGVVHIEENGPAELTAFDDYWQSQRYVNDDYDDEENDDPELEEFEVVDVSDSRQFVDEWRHRSKGTVDLGAIPLASGELFPVGALDDEKPDSQRLTEATGNEGAGFERSYHRAALVIWRRDRHADVLLQAGVSAALPYLRELVEGVESNEAGDRAESLRQVVAAARKVIVRGRSTDDWFDDAGFNRVELRTEMIELLCRIEDLELLEDFLATVVDHEFDGGENSVMVQAVHLLGPDRSVTLFQQIIAHNLWRLPGPCADLVHALASESGLAHKPAWRAALQQIAESVVEHLDDVDDRRFSETAPTLDGALPADLLSALSLLDLPTLEEAVVDRFIARPEVFDPLSVLVPALAEISGRDGAFSRLWEHCARFLLQRSGIPPEDPRDWRQDAVFSCTCDDCRELAAFAADPVERSHRFRVNKERRRHLHQIIESLRLDMTHISERTGSPYTLVCTKNRRSYRRQCETYRGDIEALNGLGQLATRSARTMDRGLLERIAAARARASRWSPAD